MNVATTSNTNAVTTGSGSDFNGIQVSITNNLTVPLDIYDVFNPAPTGQTAPYVYTKLGTIAAGATSSVTTIRAVAQLEAMYTGPIAELQNWYYYQFPVKLMSGTQFSFGNPPPISYTITQNDWNSMIQSFLFHKFAMANPDSALTKNLNTALKSTDPTAINTFFASTQNFKNCTLSSWNAVMTWLTMFTSAWQGPFYLYEAAPDPVPSGYQPALVGVVNITSTSKENSAILALATLDSNGTVQALNPPQTSTIVMAGDGTMTDQNPGNDVTLSLTPVWVNVIQTSMSGGQPTTSYISGPTLTGTVAGKKVVSTQTLIPLASQASQKAAQTASTSDKTFNNLCQIVGLIVGLVMLYEIAEKRFGGKQAAEEKAKADAKSEQDFKDQVDTIDKQVAQENSDTFTQNSDKIAADSKGVADGYSQTAETQQKDVLTKTINEESQTLENEINTQLEDGLTPTQEYENAVQETMDSFKSAQQQIDEGNLTDASTTMSDAATSMQQTIDQSAASMQQSEVDALSKSADAVDIATKQADAINEAKEQYENEIDNAKEDSGFSGEDEVPESEPIEFG